MTGGVQDKVRTGSCACGALTITCTGEPAKVSACHCRDCQRRTGSAFGVAAFFDEAKVTVCGTSKPHTRMADSGFEVEFRFCPACGSSVYWMPRRKPGIVGIAIGAFADPDFPPPSQEVNEATRQPWVTIAV